MKSLGILVTGAPPASLSDFGGFDAMTRDLLGEGFVYRSYDVQAGDLPGRPEENDAYLVTGSAAGVYEPLPWIPPLLDFLRSAKGRAKLVGICFGHQAMAQAFGGRVVLSENGRALGLHDYAVQARPGWLEGAGPLRAAVSHGDQVVDLPPDAEIVASSAFTPHAVLAYRDQPAISFQCHPEFDADFARRLTAWQERKVTPEAFSAAMASFAVPDERRRIGAGIRRFLLG